MNNNSTEPDSSDALRDRPFADLGIRIFLIGWRRVSMTDRFLEIVSREIFAIILKIPPSEAGGIEAAPCDHPRDHVRNEC